MAADDPNGWASLAKIFTQCVTWLLVVLGWIVVSDHQYHRELVKSRRETLEILREKLRTLEEKARSFHRKPFNMEDMQSILRQIHGISTELSLLKEQGVAKLSTIEDMVRLRQAITAENFDPVTHSDKPDVSMLTKIEESHQALDLHLAKIASTLLTQRSTIWQSIRDARKRVF